MLACPRSTYFDETGRNVGSHGYTQERGLQHHVNTSVSRHRSDGNLETQYTSPKVLLPGQNPAADLEHVGAISADDNLLDVGISPMHGDGFKQVLSDGLSTMLH